MKYVYLICFGTCFTLISFLVGCGEKHKLKAVLNEIEGQYRAKHQVTVWNPSHPTIDTTYPEDYYLLLSIHQNTQLKIIITDSAGMAIDTPYFFVQELNTAPELKENLLYDPDITFGANDGINHFFYDRISLFNNDSVSLHFHVGAHSYSSTSLYNGFKVP
jgi:hypothetical protein